MEVQPVDLDDVGGLVKRLLDVAVLENALPDAIRARGFVKEAAEKFGVELSKEPD